MTNNNKDYINNSLTYKYFGKKVIKNKKLHNTLIAFEELLNIKKNIKKIFNTDDPQKIKKMIGKSINNTTVTIKDFEYSNLINKNYKKFYLKCKKILEEKKNEL